MRKWIAVCVGLGLLVQGCALDKVSQILDKTASVVETTADVVATTSDIVVTTQSMFKKGYQVGYAGKTMVLDKDITVEQFDVAIKTVLSRYNFTSASIRKDHTLELQEITSDGEMKGVKFYTAYAQEFGDSSSANAPGGVLCRVIYKKPNANAFNIAFAVGVDKDLSKDAANARAAEFTTAIIAALLSDLEASLNKQ